MPDTRTINLTRNKVAIVDAADYDRLNAHKWFATPTLKGRFQAFRSVRINGKLRNIRMTREIVGLDPSDHQRIFRRAGSPPNILNYTRRNLFVTSRLMPQPL